jgi:hypothetical protein
MWNNFLIIFSGYCEAHFDSFASLCTNIAGDSPMYSLFRRNADPIKCPFKGPFSFSYSKGGTGSVCSYPRSYMDSCEDGHRLQLHFQVRVSNLNSFPKQLPLLSLKYTVIDYLTKLNWAVSIKKNLEEFCETSSKIWLLLNIAKSVRTVAISHIFLKLSLIAFFRIVSQIVLNLIYFYFMRLFRLFKNRHP